jgi:osmoprotectant transport system substrate-binding protein
MKARRSTLGLLALTLSLAATAACGSSSAPTTGTGSAAPSNASSAGDELVVLADDQHLQTVDNVLPVVSTKVATAPLETALDSVSKALTTADLVALNRQADVERKSPAAIAKAYAEDKKLLTGVSGGSGKVVVGAANFSESQILGNLYADVLEAAGFDASVKPVTNREVYAPALERGEIQVMPEYAGTFTEFLNKKLNGPDAPALASSDLAATVTALRGLADKKGLKVLEPSRAADQNAFAVTRTFATANKLRTLSDLKNYKGTLVLGGPPECPTRPFCQPGLQKTYGLSFASFVSLDAGGPLTKAALKSGKVQLGLVFSSDGSLSPL